MEKLRRHFIQDFRLTKEQIEQFDIYADLLLRWQKTINLIAPSTIDHIWHRHFYDSAQLVSIAGGISSWVDFGSGAGFPALVCALFYDSQAQFHLIESDARKCAFLKTVSRETNMSDRVFVHNCRIEDIIDEIGNVDIVSARALASLDRLVDLSLPLLERGARGLFLKGQDIVGELTKITINSRLKIDLIKSQTSSEGRIVDLRFDVRG
jgi:16S rRNA (guanine527-N7)-methyltransferase